MWGPSDEDLKLFFTIFVIILLSIGTIIGFVIATVFT